MFFIKRLALLCVFFSASLAFAAKPGKLVVEPPTLHCAGFHWEVTGASNATTAKIEYRKAGSGDWKQGLNFMHVDLDGLDFVAGSLFDLEAGTQYEARLTLIDPNGVEGEATQTVNFTTRTAPEMPDGGTTYHVYPEAYSGSKAQPLLGSKGSWRAALADPEISPLKPGDIVTMHAGEYQLAANYEAVKQRPLSEVSAKSKPTMPSGGTTWHVYPVKFKGEKLKPTIKLNHYEIPILRKDRRTGVQEVRPGDTVLFHGGEYKVNKYNYRDKLFQGPKWGVWWFWGGGEAGKPIVYKPAGDGEVIFDGSGNQAIFQVAATRHLWIDGITFQNAQCALLAGMKGLDQAEGLTITNCTFKNIDMPVYADDNPTDWYISGNEGLDAIHAGPWHEAFGSIDIRVAGTPDKPIVIQAAGDGEVKIEGGDLYATFDTTQADHVWIKNLQVSNSECVVLTGLYPFLQAPDGLIVTGLHAENVRMGVYGDESTGQGWYICDNTFIGRGVGNMSMNQHISPFGINVGGQGHIVSYNRVEWFQDGIDLCWWDRSTQYQQNDFTASVDVSHNYVYGCGDNSVEADGSYFNGRFIRNAFIYNNSASTQSTPGGPYYFIRNIIYDQTRSNSGVYKLPSSLIALHNTFSTNHAVGRYGGNKLTFVNNLFVYAPELRRRDEPVTMVQLKPLAPNCISDYNGFRFYPDHMPGKPYKYGDQEFATLEEFAAATGQNKHSILIPGYEELFVSVPEPNGEHSYNFFDFDFNLKDGVAAVDAGMVLPNINDGFKGKAPDLGAIERGDPMPHYGPRQ
ncbi:MAG: hypothetical protein ACLFUS_10815 [Candidatus Sumerlaeia bacterium]